MPALARGQENTPSIINWFITVNGVLTDAFKVEFQIWDITGGLPGTQVFPATPDEWEDVTDGVGHFSVGAYYAYDNAAAKGWTPGVAEPIGTHRVKWRWKISSAAPYQLGEEDVEILVESGGGTADTYIQVADVRAEGITEAMASDVKVLSYITMFQQLLERACRQWFIPKQITVMADGNDSDTLFFGVPIIQVDHLKLNGSSEVLDTAYYKVYNSRGYPDDRRNPRIKLIGPDYQQSIFTAPMTGGRLKFRRGYQNQEVKGIFGFTEADGSTPELIKRALLKMVCTKVTEKIFDPTAPGWIAGPVTSETTDSHSIGYGFSDSLLTSGAFSGAIDDPEVLDIIRMYRAPIGLATPANWSYD